MSNNIIDKISNVLSNIEEKNVIKLKEWGKIVQLKIEDMNYYIDFNSELKLIEGIHENSDFNITADK